MTSDKIRASFLKFWQDSLRKHKLIPAAPLVPPDDPTTLFTSSGMQQLVPFLKGEAHSMGKRLVDSQPCFRAEDIDEIGDNRHTTYFEMLGNWSLGDYFKDEQLTWFWQWLTKELKLDPKRLYVTVFAGGDGVEKDEESITAWKKLGVKEDHIFEYGADKNWWSRAGVPDKMPAGEIGGPDSEVFFEFASVKHDPKFGKTCHPNCDCGRFSEIGNSVFMQYQKQADGTLTPLPKQNVDFGGGLERLTAAVNNEPDIFKADFFNEAIKVLEAINKSNKDYKNNPKPFRIVSDHLRAALFMVHGGVEPSNKLQGYTLRRLIRRSMLYARELDMEQDEWLSNALPSLASPYTINNQKLRDDIPRINETITLEVDNFRKTIKNGLKEFDSKFPDHWPSVYKSTKTSAGWVKPTLRGDVAFYLFETYGFPLELSIEEALKREYKVESSLRESFEIEKKKHSEKSRTASAGMFKGGLADHSETVVKLHTATHLLHASLRKVLGPHVRQEGSNITSERLRLDFSHPQALTAQEIASVEKLINQKIKEDLPVVKTIEDKNKALKSGAMAFFRETYPDKVSVYTIADFSKEICGGPHVASTGQIGNVKIIKDEAIGAGKRRLYGVINYGNKKHLQKTQAGQSSR